jgi:MFS family permease
MTANNLKAVGAGLSAVLPTDGISWYQRSYLRQLNFSVFCMVILSSANGFDGSLMNGLQALPQWQDFMHHPTGAWLGFVNAAQSLGSLACFPVVAWSANRFGRKRTMFAAYFWLLLGVGLQASAQNAAMFTLGRLFIGGVTSFFGATAPLLITETAYPTHRSIVTALYNTGWYLGRHSYVTLIHHCSFR